MSSIVLLVLVAGGVFALFLFLAAMLWGIRTRRNEENFVPAPESVRKLQRKLSELDREAEKVPEWLREMENREPESAPEWMREPDQDAVGSVGTGTGTIGTEPPSPLGEILRGAAPQLSSVISLVKLVQQMQATGEIGESSEDRNASARRALDKLIEQQPGNEFLLQLRDSLPEEDESGSDLDAEVEVEVVQVGGRKVIRAGGVEYYSLMDIPDPDVREEARRLLLGLDVQDPPL